MAATMDIYEFNGAGPTGTIKTSSTIRFKKLDNATVDSNNPLVKPASSYDRSYIKSLRLFCTAAGSGTTTAANPRFYASGAPGTGVTLYAKVTATSTYTQAVAAATGTGEGPTTASAWTDVSSNYYDSSHTLSLANGLANSNFSQGNAHGNYVELYMRIDNTVAAGTTSGVTFTISWDES
jgi:hypothetical protein